MSSVNSYYVKAVRPDNNPGLQQVLDDPIDVKASALCLLPLMSPEDELIYYNCLLLLTISL